MPRSRELRLLPRDALAKTRDLDQADWSYRPVLGWVSRLRLRCGSAPQHRVLSAVIVETLTCSTRAMK